MRKVKKYIFIDKEMPILSVLVPIVEPNLQIPKLKYHGIDPDAIIGVYTDVYKSTGFKTRDGKFQMIYSHSVFEQKLKKG